MPRRPTGPVAFDRTLDLSHGRNAWLIFRSIPGPVLRLLLERLNTSREARRLAPYDGIPRYATSEEPGAGTYDLVVCDFDREIVQRYLRLGAVEWPSSTSKDAADEARSAFRGLPASNEHL